MTQNSNPLALNNLINICNQSSNRMRMMVDAGQAVAGVATHLFATELNKECDRKGGGSKPGKAPNIDRDREAGHAQLIRDYFAENPRFTDEMFRRRFRMGRPLWLRVVAGVTAQDSYFVQRRDACGKLGHSALQKCTSAIRMLAYGTPADLNDEYLRIAESTSLKCVKRFCAAVVAHFGPEYLREPNTEDTQRLLAQNAARGFPGMLGSLDCMHWRWKNCPKAHSGQYKGKEGGPTIILEAVASQDLWIWHSFFGLPGALNDINVLNHSLLFHRLAKGEAPACDYEINGNHYDKGYYLADGIYPKWATIVQTISHPQEEKKKFFAQMQEAIRKDVGCAFGVLQARFAIVAGPARMWHPKVLHIIMKACVILNNMVVEDERDGNGGGVRPIEPLADVAQFLHAIHELAPYVARQRQIENRATHFQLQADLVEHLWTLRGANKVRVPVRT